MLEDLQDKIVELERRVAYLEATNDEKDDFISWLLGDCDETEAWNQWREETQE
jgi:hypothetical protein